MNRKIGVLLQFSLSVGKTLLAIACLSVIPISGGKAQEQAMVVIEGRAIPDTPDQVLALRVSAATKHLSAQKAFITAACQLHEEQMAQLAKLDKAWLEEQCKKDAKAKDNKQAGGGFVQALRIAGGAAPMVRVQGQDSDAVIRSVKSEIDKQLKQLLNEDQTKQLKAEQAAKEQFQAEAAAELTIALLERQMYLKQEQIDQLKEALPGKINKQIGWHVFMQNKQFIPTIPQKVLSSILSESQLKVVRGMQQNDFLGSEMNLMQMFGEEAE